MTPQALVARFVSGLGLTLWLGTALVACGPGYAFDEVPTSEQSADSNTTAPPASGCGTDTYANYGKAFASSTCFGVSCHSAGATSPDLTTQAAFVTNKANVVKQVSGKTMPLGGTLSDADRARFVAWVNCNAP